MFSHIVIWWTDPRTPEAADQMISGVEKYLRPLPGILNLHVGKMIWSQRPCVDKTYQVGMTILFQDKAAHDEYMKHPMHGEFVRECFEKLCIQDLVFDYA